MARTIATKQGLAPDAYQLLEANVRGKTCLGYNKSFVFSQV